MNTTAQIIASLVEAGHEDLADQLVSTIYVESAAPKLIEFTRFVPPHEGNDIVELFLVQRDDSYYVVRFTNLGHLAIDLLAGGTKAKAKKAYDQYIDRIQRGVEMFSVPYKIETTKPDALAQQHMRAFDSPLVSLNWDVGDAPSEMNAFHKELQKQVTQWKKTSHSMKVTNDKFWPQFSKMVQEAVQKKYGSSIKLYRSVYGKVSDDVLAGKPLAVRTFSSWADSIKGAIPYRGDRYRSWAVVRKAFSPKDIMFAPVVLPEYTPDPKILLAFGKDVMSVGDELVVEIKGKALPQSSFKIVRQSSRKTSTGKHI